MFLSDSPALDSIKATAVRRLNFCLQVEAAQYELPAAFAALASLLLLRRHGLSFLLFGCLILRLFL
jgi:hypothetical protein